MLTKNTAYAIRALVYIQLKNWENKNPGVREIAREIEAPASYLAKIMQTLTKHKMVNSRKGRGGGFYFNTFQINLSLYDVILVMEGDSCFHKCAFGFKDCNDSNPCPLHENYVKIRNDFHALSRTETIRSTALKIKEGKAFLKSTSLHTGKENPV